MEADLGVSLEPMNAATYRVGKGPPPAMHPDDRALFDCLRLGGAAGGGAQRPKQGYGTVQARRRRAAGSATRPALHPLRNPCKNPRENPGR